MRFSFHNPRVLPLVAALAAATSTFIPRASMACGGVAFSTSTVTVDGSVPTGGEAVGVTDHRMVVSIGRTQTVLYDQIRFSGHPKDLAWILPVRGTVQVGVSSDELFQVLDKSLPLTITAPRAKRCPGCTATLTRGTGGPTGGGGGCGSDATVGHAAPDSTSQGGEGDGELPTGEESPVTVKTRDTVGPYDTVQVSSTDPDALSKWLTANGYAVPASFKTTFAPFIDEKFDFLALKLRPGATSDAIRPVRVAFDGASTSVPMRASAMGPAGVFGVTMYVVAEGTAYAPSNFPLFTLPTEKLAWDWAANKSNYLDLRDQESRASGYSAWEVVAAESRHALGLNLKDAPPYEGRDIDIATFGTEQPRFVTRLHTTISPAQLTQDVVLQPFEGAPLGTRRLTRSIGAPLCDTFDVQCNRTGQAANPDVLTPQSAQIPRTPSGVALVGIGTLVVAMFRPRRRSRREATAMLTK